MRDSFIDGLLGLLCLSSIGLIIIAISLNGDVEEKVQRRDAILIKGRIYQCKEVKL